MPATPLFSAMLVKFAASQNKHTLKEADDEAVERMIERKISPNTCPVCYIMISISQCLSGG
jgi:hypothetical protein